MKFDNFFKSSLLVKDQPTDKLKESIIPIEPVDTLSSNSNNTKVNSLSFNQDRTKSIIWIFLITALIFTLGIMAVFAYIFASVYQYSQEANVVSGNITVIMDQVTDAIREKQGSAV